MWPPPPGRFPCDRPITKRPPESSLFVGREAVCFTPLHPCRGVWPGLLGPVGGWPSRVQRRVPRQNGLIELAPGRSGEVRYCDRPNIEPAVVHSPNLRRSEQAH